MKVLLIMNLITISVYGQDLPFANPIINIVGTAVGSKKSNDLPYAKDIVQIVKDGINLGIKGKNNEPEQPELVDQNYEKVKVSHYQCMSKFYLKTNHKYEILPRGISAPISISELNIKVKPYQTIRASYFLKVQTTHIWYAPSFGFKVPNENDILFGTVSWPNRGGGRGITIYSFVPTDLRYYTLQHNGAIDSELVFDTRSNKNLFNVIKIDIEYTSNCCSNGQLQLEMNRDLKGYSGHTLSVIPGSSVVYEIYT